MDIKAEVTGRWPAILAELGIDLHNGHHGPCPMCGGTDRFRFADLDGRGVWVCNQCGGGDGWHLVMRRFGVDFLGAIELVRPHVGCDAAAVKKRDPEKARHWLRELWRGSVEARPGDPVSGYLEGRGLDLPQMGLRFAPKCYEAETKREMPAMLGVITGPDGHPVTMHRTYLAKLSGWVKANIEKPKKLMPTVGPILGGAIRLYEVDDVMGVAEGIETAIACHRLFGVPTWACVSSTVLVAFRPPASVRRVYVYGDCDSNFCGQKAAFELANRLSLTGTDVGVEIPIEPGTDWADVLAQKGSVAA